MGDQHTTQTHVSKPIRHFTVSHFFRQEAEDAADAGSEDLSAQGFLNVPISGKDGNGGYHVTGYVGEFD